jgi:16S rRNA (guanine527-N7)-methyltransferase
VSFEEQLFEVLPPDLPNRSLVVEKAGKHLELIVEANEHFNLTRITGERDAAIKHVLDSVMPWRLFSEATHVLDAGSGAGYPGIPLAVVLPSVRFTLAESIGKKARFIEFAIQTLELTNVESVARRAEEVLRSARMDVLTARAVAPVSRATALFGPAVKRGTRLLLYKGPDARTEIVEAEVELRKVGAHARVVQEYELPDGAGSRTVVEIARKRS